MEIEQILLVEDSQSTQMVVQSILEPLCRVHCASSLADADQKLKSNSYSLILLDVELPDGNGFDYCQKLKADQKYFEVPIIFLTSRSEVDQKVLGFSLGAEDYIVKPPEPKEFLARIEARIRRKISGEAQTSFNKLDFKVDLGSHKIHWLKSEPHLDLSLTPIEFRLMVYLLRNEGKVVPKNELITGVWGNLFVSEHTVHTHISSLRGKIEETGHTLKAVIRKGYCLSSKNAP